MSYTIDDFLQKKFEKRWYECASKYPTLKRELDYHTNALKKCIKHNVYDWGKLSCNPKLTSAFINKHINKPWSWKNLSRNSALKWKVVVRNIDKPWNWYFLTENPSITWKIIEANPNYKWVWPIASSKPNVTWKFVSKHLDYKWDWTSLSRTIVISHKELNKNLDKPWNWKNLSVNPNINWKFVTKVKKGKWIPDKLQANSSIHFKHILKNMDDISHVSLCLNSTVSWDYIKMYEPYVDWYDLSKNPAITLDIKKNNKQFKWHHSYGSFNRSLTWKQIDDDQKTSEKNNDSKLLYKVSLLYMNKMDYKRKEKIKLIKEIIFTNLYKNFYI